MKNWFWSVLPLSLFLIFSASCAHNTPPSVPAQQEMLGLKNSATCPRPISTPKAGDPCLDSGDGLDDGEGGPATFKIIATPSLIFQGNVTWGSPCGSSQWITFPDGPFTQPIDNPSALGVMRCFNVRSQDLGGNFTVNYEGSVTVDVKVNFTPVATCNGACITTCQSVVIPNKLLKVGLNNVEFEESCAGGQELGISFEVCGPLQAVDCFITSTATQSPTATLTGTSPPTLSPTATRTFSLSPSATPTITPSLSITPSISRTPSQTTTPSVTSSETVSGTPSASVSPTQGTPSVTPTPTCPGFGYKVPIPNIYYQGAIPGGGREPWADTLLDHSNVTISVGGCFLTCFSTLAQVNPGALNIDLSDYQNAIDQNGNLTQEKAAEFLGWPGPDERAADDDTIAQALKEGRYVIANVPHHFVVVTGSVFDTATGRCRFTIQDPGGLTNNQFLDQYTPLNIRTFGSNGNVTPAN